MQIILLLDFCPLVTRTSGGFRLKCLNFLRSQRIAKRAGKANRSLPYKDLCPHTEIVKLTKKQQQQQQQQTKQSKNVPVQSYYPKVSEIQKWS